MSDNSKPYLIGIAGGSSSGKTSFLNQLVSLMPDDSVSVISQDNYYFPKEHQKKDKNGRHNFDLPTSIDRTSFFLDINKLLLEVSQSNLTANKFYSRFDFSTVGIRRNYYKDGSDALLKEKKLITK